MSDNLRLGLIVGGIAAVLVAVIWRVVVVNGRRRRLRKGLRAADPQDRARAGILLVDEGLHRSARVILAHVATEQDVRVNHAIALAVARRQWEPVDAQGARQLREWASQELERRGEPVAPFGRAVTRLSDMGGPRPPDYQGPAEASPYASGPAGTGPSPVAPAETDAEVHWRAGPTRFAMTRVLVTGAGGAAGISVLRALMASGVETVAGDPDPLAAGRRLADREVALPRATAPEFAATVVTATAQTGADAVVCTVAEEMVPLASVTSALRDGGVSLWLSPVEAVQTCVDKQAFATAASAAGLPVPATSLGSADGVPGPWVVKPRFGRGSRDVHLVHEPEDLAAAIRRTPDPIVQTRCSGREFTADVLVGHDGGVAGLVARWRLETKAGISTKGETFSDPLVTSLVHATVDAIGLQAACNIQGFLDDSARTIALVEVNPRFSGGLPLSQAAGADLVGEMLRGTLGLPIRPERLVARDGVVMTRYFDEVFFDTAAPAERA